MIINSMDPNSIQMIKAVKVIDEWDRTFYKVRAKVVQTIDLKSFRDKQAAQDYLDELAEAVKDAEADTVIVSEL